jgi:hypothetical protein
MDHIAHTQQNSGGYIILNLNTRHMCKIAYNLEININFTEL